MSSVIDDLNGTALKEVYSPEWLERQMEKSSAFIAHMVGGYNIDFGAPHTHYVLNGITDDGLVDQPKYSTVIHTLEVPDEAPEVFIDPFPTERLILLGGE